MYIVSNSSSISCIPVSACNSKNIVFRIYASSQSSAKYISIMDEGDGMSENELTHKAMQWGPEVEKVRQKMILFVAASAMSSEISVRHVECSSNVSRPPRSALKPSSVFFEFYSNVFPHSEIRL